MNGAGLFVLHSLSVSVCATGLIRTPASGGGVKANEVI